jgi:hypothetical protein
MSAVGQVEYSNNDRYRHDKKLKGLRLATKGCLGAALFAVALISKVEAKPVEPFKFEILPSEKCVLTKIDPNPDPVLKCLKLKGVPNPNPTNPGDPTQGNPLSKRIPTPPSEMQKVLDWCKNKTGIWTSDGENGGSCQLRNALIQQQKVGVPEPTPTNPGLRKN